MIQRKNYFIKKRFQFNFALRFLLLLLLESVLIAGLFIHISSNTLTTGYMDSVLTIERTPNFFFMPFLIVMLIVGVGVALAGMVVFILLSHRIAGPLYRFEKDLGDIASGDLTKRINIRRTDQLTELKESLNTLVESIDQRMGRINAIAADLKVLLTKKDDPQQGEKVYNMVERLKDEIGRFKVTSGSLKE